ncbi:protein rep, partial [Acinetobacter baumannii]|nr:protein rep [Acinetobacter baumannii]
LDKKKPLLSDSLATGDNKGFASPKGDQHRDRITRFGILKHRSKQQENYLFSLAKIKENYHADVKNDESIRAMKTAQKLNGCGNFLLFKNFYTIDQIKLAKFQACSEHLLCPFCAGIRASKAIQKYSERVDQVLSENPRLKPVMITFTVKNGVDLRERFTHLIKSFRTLIERRRDYIKKGRGFNEFCKINGAMYSYENTYNEKTNEWHPHIHVFALLDDWIDQDELSQYWQSITGDSMVVDIRRAKKQKDLGYSGAAAEVCKYALKFGDLSVEKTWEAFKVLKGKRLSGAFGSLWGVKIPESLIDDLPDDSDLPYLEMIYKFVFSKKSYYDLQLTRHVEPTGKDAADELRGVEGRNLLVSMDGRGVSDAGRARTGALAPQHGRKKQHWQIPPVTRVRVRKRIRRWDGYLCVLHL